MFALGARRPSLRGLFTLLIMLARSPVAAQGQPAVLDLAVNGVSHGQIFVVLGEHDVWADVASLERAGLVAFGGERVTRNDRALYASRRSHLKCGSKSTKWPWRCV